MAVRLSTALQNFLASTGDVRRALAGGKIEIYSGSQPANPNLAPTGTLLVTFTSSSGAWTAETPAQGSFTLSGSTGGQVTQIAVAGINLLRAVVPYNSSLNQTATDVITAINNYANPLGIVAASGGGAKVLLIAPRDSGTRANSLAVTSTVVTMTGTNVNVGTEVAGVDSVNGLHLGVSATGIISILTGETWSGVVATGGTAGWFRYKGSVADAGALDTSTFIRLDGSVATSGAELNISSTTLVASATQTATSFQITEPAQ